MSTTIKQLEKKQFLDISKGFQGTRDFGKLVVLFCGFAYLCIKEWQHNAARITIRKPTEEDAVNDDGAIYDSSQAILPRLRPSTTPPPTVSYVYHHDKTADGSFVLSIRGGKQFDAAMAKFVSDVEKLTDQRHALMSWLLSNSTDNTIKALQADPTFSDISQSADIVGLRKLIESNPRQHNAIIIGSIFFIKFKRDGRVSARLAACGNQMPPGSFSDCSASTSEHQSYSLVLAAYYAEAVKTNTVTDLVHAGSDISGAFLQNRLPPRLPPLLPGAGGQRRRRLRAQEHARADAGP